MRYVALVVLVAFATAGCADRAGSPAAPPAAVSADPSASASTAAPARLAPKDALLGSTTFLTATTFNAKLAYPNGVTLDSTVDPLAKTAQLRYTGGTATNGFVVEQVNVGGEVFVKHTYYGGGPGAALPAGWMVVDLSKINKPAKLALTVPDPARLDEILATVRTVERTGDRTFTGTVDLNGIGRDTIVNDTSSVKGAPVPFEATVDDQGRIATFTIKAPKKTYSVAYSGWGGPLTVTKPSGAVPAPRSYYVLYNGF